MSRAKDDWICRSYPFEKWANRVIEWNAVARLHDYSDSNKDKQWALVDEEFKELKQAYKDQDPVEFIDAVCDLFVVTSYWCFLDSQGVIDIEGIEGLFNSTHTLEQELGMMESSDIPHKRGCSLLSGVMHLCYLCGADMEGAMNEVLSSNDSKYPYRGHMEVEALEQECKNIEERSKGRYTEVDFEINSSRVIFKDSNGKIMKPTGFKAPNLEQYLYNKGE